MKYEWKKMYFNLLNLVCVSYVYETNIGLTEK